MILGELTEGIPEWDEPVTDLSVGFEQLGVLLAQGLTNADIARYMGTWVDKGHNRDSGIVQHRRDVVSIGFESLNESLNRVDSNTMLEYGKAISVAEA